MQNFSKFFLLAVTAAGLSLGAAETSQPWPKVADFTGTNKFFSDTAAGFQCKSGTQKTGFRIFGKKSFPVTAGKKYKISYEYRMIPGGEETGLFFVGFKCIDKKGREIGVRQVLAYPNTQTVLTAPVNKGDKVLKVKDGSKWKTFYPHAAFNAKADFSDLPNWEISPQIIKMEKTGNFWTFTLKSPMTKAYPAGTAVRYHSDGATYRYVNSSIKAKPQWQSFSRIYSGFCKTDFSSGSTFRPGTASIQPVIFPNESYGRFNVEFRNIKVEEVK